MHSILGSATKQPACRSDAPLSANLPASSLGPIESVTAPESANAPESADAPERDDRPGSADRATAARPPIRPDEADRDDFGGEYPFRGFFLDLPAAGTIETAGKTSHEAETVALHFLDEGPRDAPPLLLVHGNPTWSFAWRNLIKGLAGDFRCVAVDHIGCGRSDKPPRFDSDKPEAGGYPYRLAQHRNNLQTLIETLDLRDATLIAHDWGGAIGCAAAGELFERFASVVLMNTAAFPAGEMPWRIAACRVPVLGPLGVRGLNGFARAALSMAVEKPLPADVRRGYLAPYSSWGDRVAIQAFVDDIPMSREHPSWDALEECERKLPNLAAKRILLPWGEKDWCFTTAFRDRFVERFPGAIVQRFPEAGHYVFEDAATELLVTLKAFLRR